MADRGTEFERTVDACVALLGTMAETIAVRPHSTLAPRNASAESERLASMLRELAGAGDRVRLEELIAEGGMAAVHLATQRSLGRKVAVKTPLAGARDANAIVHTAPLLREAWVAGSLEHPNVVPVYDVYLADNGEPHIVLKRVEGSPWRELMHDKTALRERFGPGDVLEHNLRILMQVCHAAHFAHTRGIVHRDLKPDNVMIGDYGEVLLIDWGIAVSLHEDDTGRFLHANDAVDLAGTPAYMAPEMLGPHYGRVSVATDVYLLGAVLYEIICRHPPHRGPSSADMVRSILRSTPAFPPDAPEELVSIVKQAMSADSSKRHASAEQVRLALQEFMQHRSSGRLAREAERTLERLAALVAQVESAREKRGEVFRLFGACQFGFDEALGTWPDNRIARQGRERALALMAGYEAEHGDAGAAAALLSEISEPPVELVDRVQAARGRREAERRRIAELERLGRLFDPRAEVRARWTVTAGLALLATVVPLFTSQFVDPKSEDYRPLLGLPAAFLAAAIAAVIWKRHALAQTAQNRWVMATVLVALAGQILVYTGGLILGLRIVAASALGSLLWAALAAMLAVALDRRILTVALGYLAAFFAIALAAADRRDAVYILSAAHLVTAITVGMIWRPGAARSA